MATRAPAPSAGQQKSFIIENAGILNRETKLTILNIVMLEVGKGAVIESGSAKEVDIDLDRVSSINEVVLPIIYNIVAARREALNQPAGTQAHHQ
jgi:hypothetical protein